MRFLTGGALLREVVLSLGVAPRTAPCYRCRSPVAPFHAVAYLAVPGCPHQRRHRLPDSPMVRVADLRACSLCVDVALETEAAVKRWAWDTIARELLKVLPRVIVEDVALQWEYVPRWRDDLMGGPER